MRVRRSRPLVKTSTLQLRDGLQVMTGAGPRRGGIAGGRIAALTGRSHTPVSLVGTQYPRSGTVSRQDIVPRRPGRLVRGLPPRTWRGRGCAREKIRDITSPPGARSTCYNPAPARSARSAPRPRESGRCRGRGDPKTISPTAATVTGPVAVAGATPRKRSCLPG